MQLSYPKGSDNTINGRLRDIGGQRLAAASFISTVIFFILASWRRETIQGRPKDY